MTGMVFENYVVYPDGRIWSNYKNGFLIPQDNGTGYMKVLVKVNGKPTNMYVHRLVATAFVPNPSRLKEVNHIDGNKKNNHFSNLEWCSCKKNKEHAAENNLTATGERNAAHKLTKEEVRTIRRLYKPYSKDYNTWTLAEMFGVSQTNIIMIVNDKYWRGA